MKLTFLIALALSFAVIGLAQEASPTPDYGAVGERTGTSMSNGVAVTKGVIRVRRRHENDMDFSKYNPFYWEGRGTWFSVEDHTPNGENKIRFRLHTEWPQDYTKYRGSDFSAIYTGDPLAHETERSKFAINARMKHLGDFRHFEYVLDEGWFKTGKLEKGQLLVFEFRFFNNKEHPGWAVQQKRNPHNLSAYYSEFLRIRIGEPGLLIDRFGESEAFPSPAQYAGGWTTTPTTRVEPWTGLQQQAFNLTPERSQDFLTGRTWFHTDLVDGRHLSDPSDDKPSMFFQEMETARKDYAAALYNRKSCNQCHIHNGISLLPNVGEAVHNTVAKTFAREGGPHSAFGLQLQTDGADAEGELFLERFETLEFTLGDRNKVELRRPVFGVRVDGEVRDDVALGPRKVPALIGAGLLDAVPAETLKAFAAKNGGSVGPGRFGWKAAQPTLRSQIQDALLTDMGVRSKGFTKLDGETEPGKGELPEQAIDELEAYVALLGVPPRTNPEDPAVKRGEALFAKLDCTACHVPELKTGASKFAELSRQTIYPYTDLLLHDMGPGLADPGKDANARLWRTAPLWGLKNVRHATDDFRKTFRPGDTNITFEETLAAADKNRLELLHDGRARSVTEAILWHSGEAAESAKRYIGLSAEERNDLEAFLLDL